jgi:hypothetical protein
MRRAGLKIDIAPTQREYFSAPHPCGDGEAHHVSQQLAASLQEAVGELLSVFGGQPARSSLGALWLPDGLHGILQKWHAPFLARDLKAVVEDNQFTPD